MTETSTAILVPAGNGAGGAGKRLMTLADGLRSLGETVHVINASDVFTFGASKSKKMSLPSKLVRALSLLAGGTSESEQLRDLFVRCFPNPDVVIARNALAVLAAAPVARNLGMRLVWDIGIETRRAGRSLLLARALSLSDTVVTQSTAQLADVFPPALRSLARKKVHSILPGIEPPRIRDVPAYALRHQAKFKILIPASISRRKGQLRAIRALATMPAAARDQVVLWFAGEVADPQYRQHLESVVEKSPLAQSVHWLGFRTDVADWMQCADLVLLPSDNEGVPNAIQEAMWLGRPVAASAVGGIPELIKNDETGWLFDPNDITALAALLMRIIENSGLRDSVGKAAQDFAQVNFTASAWIKKYQAVLRPKVKDA